MNKVNIYNKSYPKIKSAAKKVSVIIPNYNYQDYIIERIDSVLNQTYPIYELIILDDKSTDNSVKVIEDKIATIKDVNVKFIKNDKNSGSVFKQWQKGIHEAKGDYFWIAEADDSSDPRFLESLMVGFDDENVVLAYSDSTRIDENNNIITKNALDATNVFGIDKWHHSNINDGIDEIKKYLVVTNTIINVSSVVWKMNNYDSILDEAAKFTVAGDWYTYYRVLENGSIYYSNKTYNYFRKHSKSVSTVVNRNKEYLEVCRIQDEICDKYDIDIKTYKLLRIRKDCMEGDITDRSILRKKIAWVVPYPGKGSGGHRTIFQNVNALVKAGYECDVYVPENYLSTSETLAKDINDFYGFCAANCYVGVVPREQYDLVFATGWQTIDEVKNFDCPKKAYFIQDYEPLFMPMGDSYIKTERSYALGFTPITIGKWLSHKMINEYGLKSQYFDFCADLNVYHPLENVKKENAICYIYQPEKPRRCDVLGISALQIVKTLRPDINIYLYGNSIDKKVDFEVTKLGIIPIETCNELYNKCKIGMCISSSNPSRIPFEMMATGLPVVELYMDNNLYDFPNDGVKLAEPTPEAIASLLLKLIDDDKELKKMSKAGLDYMKDYPLEKGFEQFIEAVNNLFDDNSKIEKIKIEQSYKQPMYTADSEVSEKAKEILPSPNFVAFGGPRRRLLRRIKRTLKDKTKGIFYKIANLIEKL